MKKNIYCVFDTETIGIEKKLIYDLGLVITAKKGDILHRKQWIIEEVFTNKSLMKQAYYGYKKALFYEPLLNKNPELLVSFSTAKKEFNEILREYSVSHISAYNLMFDMSAISQTLKQLNIEGKFLEMSLNYFDLWAACCLTIFQHKRFQKMAINEGWLTQAGNIRTSAEIAYRYLTENVDFIEQHTALSDASIEADILQYMLRQKKAFPKNTIKHHPWRLVQKKK